MHSRITFLVKDTHFASFELGANVVIFMNCLCIRIAPNDTLKCFLCSQVIGF